MSVVVTLQHARSLLRTEGWRQGASSRDRHGPMTLFDAIETGIGATRTPSADIAGSTGVIADVLGIERDGHLFPLVAWHDTKGRTSDEVFNVIERGIMAQTPPRGPRNKIARPPVT